MGLKDSIYILCAVTLISSVTRISYACEKSSTIEQNTQYITNAEKKAIVTKHNELRSLVREGKVKHLPKAKNMRDLKWDDKLSETAQQLANRCIFEHVYFTVQPYGAVGQNIFMKSSSEPFGKSCDYDGAIQSWYNEVKDFQKKDISPFRMSRDHDVGHFTQIAWANTRNVGCGCKNFRDIKDAKYPYKQLISCNYGPAGNILGGQMYQV